MVFTVVVEMVFTGLCKYGLPKNAICVMRGVLHIQFFDPSIPIFHFSNFCSIMPKMTPYGIICK